MDEKDKIREIIKNEVIDFISGKPYKITRAFVEKEITLPMGGAGFNVMMVGSLALKGYSFKDIDILLRITSEEEFVDFEKYLKNDGWKFTFSDENPTWGIFHNYEKDFDGNLLGMDVFVEEI